MSHLARRNRRTAFASLAVIAMMSGLVYYSVPLYRLFCQVTGFGGTVQQAAAAPGAVGERVITVAFNADISTKLPWTFRSAQRQVRVRVGEEAIAVFVAHNTSGEAATGTATFNVTPAKAGQYFNKIECFCFKEQRLAAGAREEMPVSFFVDPAILNDRSLDDVSTITLSYTMFRKPDGETGERTTATRIAPAATSKTN